VSLPGKELLFPFHNRVREWRVNPSDGLEKIRQKNWLSMPVIELRFLCRPGSSLVSIRPHFPAICGRVILKNSFRCHDVNCVVINCSEGFFESHFWNTGFFFRSTFHVVYKSKIYNKFRRWKGEMLLRLAVSGSSSICCELPRNAKEMVRAPKFVGKTNHWVA